MKSGALLLLIVIIFAVRCAAAAEVSPGGPPPPPDKKIAPPVVVKPDAEKGGAIEVKGKVPETKKVVKPGAEKGGAIEVKGKVPETKKAEERVKGADSELKGSVEESGVEECDPSNRCIDEKNKFVACLRVPGKDSLDLSLLIENKGAGSLDINIVAPGFVKLEQATVRLQSKENKEVKVSVQDGANDTLIVLKAGEGDCSLNFRNMIPESAMREKPTFFGYSRLSTRSSLITVFLVAATLGCVVLLCLKYRHMKHQEGGSKYQSLGMELPKTELGLPVSSGGKKEEDEVDGWDGSWDDNWDEEAAAPSTPSKSVQNLSSKGLASRKSNKDGWKD